MGGYFGSLVLPHTNFEISPYMIYICSFLKVPRQQSPNERVCFSADSYVGSRHILILPPTSPPPSTQSIDTQLRRGELGGSPAARGSTIPFSSMTRFNLDFKESKPNFLLKSRDNPQYKSVIRVHKRQQSLLLHAVVQSDISFVCNGQQLICIKATDTRTSTF